MAQRGIREFCAKQLFAKHWNTYFKDFTYDFKSTLVHSGNDLKEQVKTLPWLASESLVIKPDMLFGKRGRNELVLLKDKIFGDIKLDMATQWIDSKSLGETVLICGTKGYLDTFVAEPFYKHSLNQEYYLALSVEADHDVLYISAHGGMDVEEKWDKVTQLKLALDLSPKEVNDVITKSIPADIKNKEKFISFTQAFYKFFKDLHFSYLELNPLIIAGDQIHLLDIVARIDDTARFLMTETWGNLECPPSFGTPPKLPQENKIQEMDEKSGASFKLTVLNPKGLLWTLVAGGGASVVYADSIADHWGAAELANYGEYSGNPTTDETYFYAKNVLQLMTKAKDRKRRDKILIIGGSIANFTDVAKTFDGIIKAFTELHSEIQKVGVKIYVRRGGPNYEIGLRNIQTAAEKLLLPIKVYGPETHLTDIVRLALAEQN